MNFQEETLPPTHPPAMWLRSIFDYVVNMCTAINLPSSLQPLLITTLAHPTWQDSTLRSSSFFPASFVCPAPPHAWEALLVSQAVETPDKAPHSLLVLVRGAWSLFICTCASPLLQGVTHTWRTRLSHLHSVKEGTTLGSAQDSKRELPPCKAFSTWTQSALVGNSHLYTAAFQRTQVLGKKPKYFPPFIIPK